MIGRECNKCFYYKHLPKRGYQNRIPSEDVCESRDEFTGGLQFDLFTLIYLQFNDCSSFRDKEELNAQGIVRKDEVGSR
jgi:hypothetical protein